MHPTSLRLDFGLWRLQSLDLGGKHDHAALTTLLKNLFSTVKSTTDDVCEEYGLHSTRNIVVSQR